jgi:hypothetical protein
LVPWGIPIELLESADEYSSTGQSSGLSEQSNPLEEGAVKWDLRLETATSSRIVVLELPAYFAEGLPYLLLDRLQMPDDQDAATLATSVATQYFASKQC